GDADVGDLLGAGMGKRAALGHRERAELFAFCESGFQVGDGDVGRTGSHDLQHFLESLILGFRGEPALDELGVEKGRKLHAARADYNVISERPSRDSQIPRKRADVEWKK